MERIEMHPRMVKLLRHHHLLTVATSSEDKPWCASCFYAWNNAEQWFVLTTNPDTRHGVHFTSNASVAGTIALETHRVGRIRGAQFTGTVSLAEGEILTRARKDYLLRFPYALAADLHLWIIRPEFIKLTDNRLGFGKKITWERIGN
jgi:uncharacterized protein